jgi:phosphohistidine phosphatase
MDLYFLRHAPAIARGSPGFSKDAERPLTPEGAEKMRRIAKGMKALGLSFDLILSSPYLRARQTAEIAAKVLKEQKHLKFTENLVSEGSPAALIRELLNDHDAHDSIMLVGHEPGMSELMSRLLTGDSSLTMNFKKGGLCKLSVESLRFGKCAKLEWLLTPRQLVRLAKQ